jgi:hypothetical protein
MKNMLLIITLMAFVCNVSAQNSGINFTSTDGSSIHSGKYIISWTIGEDLTDFTVPDAAEGYRPESRPEVLEMKGSYLLYCNHDFRFWKN